MLRRRLGRSFGSLGEELGNPKGAVALCSQFSSRYPQSIAKMLPDKALPRSMEDVLPYSLCRAACIGVHCIWSKTSSASMSLMVTSLLLLCLMGCSPLCGECTKISPMGYFASTKSDRRLLLLAIAPIILPIVYNGCDTFIAGLGPAFPQGLAGQLLGAVPF